jgi:hypothetical protein
MNDQELQELLHGRSPMERRVYEALRDGGPSTDRQLRELLRSRGSGPRDAMEKLLPTGLVRQAGVASTAGKPKLWEATPLSEVEATAKSYEVRKPRRRRAPKSVGRRLGQLRQMEDGDCREWYPARDQILAAYGPLAQFVRMAFWEAVQPDELELALKEIEELHEATGEAAEVGRERMKHEKHKSKIEKLRSTKGRPEPEKETAHRLADNLNRKLIPGEDR